MKEHVSQPPDVSLHGAWPAAIDLWASLGPGQLHRPSSDPTRIDAFVPSAGGQNHAASLCQLPSGDLLCAWFAGSVEGAGDIRIALSRLPTDGDRWLDPVWVSEDRGRSEQNPVLFATPHGSVWLLYTAQATRAVSPDEWQRRVATGDAQGPYCMQWTAAIRRRVSTDGGHSWGAVETFSAKPGSFCRQPPCILANGTWLLPMYYSLPTGASSPSAAHGDDHSVVRISTDEGHSWEERPIPESRGRVHASIVEPEPGELLAFLRSRAADRIYVSRSHDHGWTWTSPTPIGLPNNNASIQAIRLASGCIALVYNAYSAGADPQATLWPSRRWPLTIALSEDGGRTWPYRRHIDSSDGFCGPANVALNRRCSYPAILQTRDERIWVAYSYRDRQAIKVVSFDEGWIRGRQRT